MGLWYLGGLPDEPETAARSFAACSQRIMFTGHHNRWFLATPAGPADWDGANPIRLAAAQRYLVVIAAVCEGRWDQVASA